MCVLSTSHVKMVTLKVKLQGGEAIGRYVGPGSLFLEMGLVPSGEASESFLAPSAV